MVVSKPRLLTKMLMQGVLKIPTRGIERNNLRPFSSKSEHFRRVWINVLTPDLF